MFTDKQNQHRQIEILISHRESETEFAKRTTDNNHRVETTIEQQIARIKLLEGRQKEYETTIKFLEESVQHSLLQNERQEIREKELV